MAEVAASCIALMLKLLMMASMSFRPFPMTYLMNRAASLGFKHKSNKKGGVKSARAWVFGGFWQVLLSTEKFCVPVRCSVLGQACRHITWWKKCCRINSREPVPPTWPTDYPDPFLLREIRTGKILLTVWNECYSHIRFLKCKII